MLALLLRNIRVFNELLQLQRGLSIARCLARWIISTLCHRLACVEVAVEAVTNDVPKI